MVSSSCFAFISVVVVSQFLLLISASASTSPKYVDAICNNVFNGNVTNKAFCLKTLKSYPPVVNATNQFEAAEAAIRLVLSYAAKYAVFTEKAATNNPKLKKQFKACQDAFMNIVLNLRLAAGKELKDSPDSANYEVMVCYDQTKMVMYWVGKNKDKASQSIIKMKLMMEKLIGIAVGATVSVGG